MPENNLILNIITGAAAAIIGFLVAYISEKGKNYATKKDIREITQKVEDVKSGVQILTEDRISYNSWRNEALISLCEKHSAWLNSILDIHFYLEDKDAIKTYDDSYKILLKYSNEFLLAEVKVNIFYTDDEELKNQLNIIGEGTLSLQIIVINALRFIIQKMYSLPLEELIKLDSIPKNNYKLSPKTYEEFYDKKEEAFKALSNEIKMFYKLVNKRILENNK